MRQISQRIWRYCLGETSWQSSLQASAASDLDLGIRDYSLDFRDRDYMVHENTKLLTSLVIYPPSSVEITFK